MDRILNITNGDSAVHIMKQAGLSGVFLPWQDILHEGPVPANLSLEVLSAVRADFIISRGWGDPQTVRESFVERDNLLKCYGDFSKIILWFEHDLYDQLQLLQILDWFADNYQNDTPLTIICVDHYLGMATPAQMKGFLKYEKDVTAEHLNVAKKAWQAFRATTPTAWQGLLKEDTSVMPFLEGSVKRLLEEYPSTINGLSRTAQQALRIIFNGEKRPGRIFGMYQESEERRFLGDLSFWSILQDFVDSQPPLLSLPAGKELSLPSSPDQTLLLTPIGIEVLQGQSNWLDISPIDRWLGGVHLVPENVWCWNPASGVIEQR